MEKEQDVTPEDGRIQAPPTEDEPEEESLNIQDLIEPVLVEESDDDEETPFSDEYLRALEIRYRNITEFYRKSEAEGRSIGDT